jgi:hypothetical protein
MLKTVSTISGLVSPTFSGNVTLSTGNLVIGTSGKGIDFSATPGTGTSELLADYEEGTFTPTLSAFSGTITTVGACTGRYTKIGRSVTVSIDAAITINGLAAVTLFIAGLPFAGAAIYYAGCGEERNTAKALSVEYATAASRLNVYFYDGTYPGANGSNFIISLTYDV